MAIDTDALLSAFILVSFQKMSSIVEKILHLEGQRTNVTHPIVETPTDIP